MLPRETIHKARVLLQKTLRSFKSLVSGGYQKLPRSLSLNPFLRRSGNARTYYSSDQFYNEFYDILQSDLNRIRIRNDDMIMIRSREPPPASASASASVVEDAAKVEEGTSKKQSPLKKNKGETTTTTTTTATLPLKNKKVNSNNNNDALAKKMKELEMMDSGDVEHVLDIEEALHYYSRLTSPVYLDIVDKFFIDMQNEFNVPLPQLPHSSSVRIKRSKSKGRFGSLSGCR
ncbi:hypothetical protein HN51_026564 [Arachis hypogaea]|uniref:OVATE domain-containing protein n=2 Tax=Arachis hypogaea TaxID=3818 RepID=A0A444Y9B6_ARAHY|nr:uncharacterized protein LOC112703677 [Arachis hypogaea]XP_025674145.1 uncharacterized protein LOC112773282 [Arachis hypogaea]QHN94694.1 uncharacterized protein DS421_18g603310 [Arachis hypogaea]RYQ98437.1 hypothetical protein Ahy_B08g094477 [Arachis hypogaea]RYR50714.1 hypothetical protein Ahy_A07g037340 [Arachis hypogaea]